MPEVLFQGHGSFRMISDTGRVIYIDPFAGEGYDIPADLILVSHEHRDHNMTELVAKKKDTVILRAADLHENGAYLEKEACGVKILAVPAYNRNHPADKCVGFVVTDGEKKIYFAGDTSRTGAMEGQLHDMKLDIAFLPTDGIYNMDVKEASLCASLIAARQTVPVHMKPGALFDEEISKRFECEGKRVLRPGESLKL